MTKWDYSDYLEVFEFFLKHTIKIPNNKDADIIALSGKINKPTDSIIMAARNFQFLYTNGKQGLSNGNKMAKDIWEEYKRKQLTSQPSPKEIIIKINDFVDKFLKYLAGTNNTFNFVEDNRKNIIKRLNLGNGYSIRFLEEWSKEYQRKYYLILYKDEEYIWELFLPRILFNNSRLTWDR